MSDEMRVEVDDRIKLVRELHAAVGKATEYFVSEYLDLPPDPLWRKAFIKWIPAPGRDGYLRLLFGEEHQENGGYVDFVDLPASQLHDEISRNTWMRNLLRRVVIKHRSQVASERIDRFILELGHADG